MLWSAASAADGAAARPALYQGGLGAFDGAAGLRQPGLDPPANSSGGAVVFDATRHLAGITRPGTAGAGAMLPVSPFRCLDRAASGQAGADPPLAPDTRMPIDEA